MPRCAHGNTWVLRTAGEHRRPDEDTLTRRRRRVLGEDHPDTLLSATNLAADLRLAQAAYLAGGVTVAPT